MGPRNGRYKPIFFLQWGREGPKGPPTRRNARQRRRWRPKWWQGRWRRRGGLIRPRAASTILYLLKGRGRGRVVTQRYFGPTRSLAARSAATLTVAASRAAHEHLSPTGGRTKRVARMGRSGGCEVGKGGRSSLGAGVRWLDGRKRAGPTLHVCRATARARGWVWRAPSDSISVSLPVDSART